MTEQSASLSASLKSLQASPLNMRRILEELSQVLDADDSWSRAEIFRAGEMLLEQKHALAIKGLWQTPPRMLTATLDDALGQGLQIIHLFSRIAGVDVEPLGLMLSPEKITASGVF